MEFRIIDNETYVRVNDILEYTSKMKITLEGVKYDH